MQVNRRLRVHQKALPPTRLLDNADKGLGRRKGGLVLHQQAAGLRPRERDTDADTATANNNGDGDGDGNNNDDGDDSKARRAVQSAFHRLPPVARASVRGRLQRARRWHQLVQHLHVPQPLLHLHPPDLPRVRLLGNGRWHRSFGPL